MPLGSSEARLVLGVQTDGAPLQVSRTRTTPPSGVSMPAENAAYRPVALNPKGPDWNTDVDRMNPPTPERSCVDGVHPGGAPRQVSRRKIPGWPGIFCPGGTRFSALELN